jgi:hypothetical protein
LRIDLARGFAITHLTNRWLSGSIAMDSIQPGLELVVENQKVAVEDLRLAGVSQTNATATEKEATVTYTAQAAGAALELRISVFVNEDDPEVGLHLTALNCSGKELHAKILFPLFRASEMGNLDDVWYLYPSFRTQLSNQPGTYEHIYSLSFPLQFCDVFNPRLGGGFYLATRETDVRRMRRYGLAKDASGITCHIQYPSVFTVLGPNEPFSCCRTVIGVHPGDWHAAARHYQTWLKSWYQPLHCQDKQWYRHCFWLLCEYMDTVSEEVGKGIQSSFKGWYDPQTKRYRMREILEEHKRTVGRDPDIFHFWSWIRGGARFGSYGSSQADYEALGGRENFRKAIEEIQKGMGINVSIYLDASLCNARLPIAQKLGTSAAIQSMEGEARRDYGSLRMCPGVTGWREYMQEAYRRVNHDLGVNILYVDEWAPPFANGRWLIPSFTCWAKDHGHACPANMNEEVHRYMKELRLTVPAEAVLYGEYQDVDVNSQFYDCTIDYYLSRWAADPREGRDNLAYDTPLTDTGLRATYLNLYRYLLPGQVQLALPNDVAYYSWHPLKFTFLNGDSVYDSFWMRAESRAEQFMVHSFDIKKKYADCFRSYSPEMLVPTEKAGLLANRFPGEGRTVWTLYNSGYTTMRGSVLRIKHVEGARYIDLWNDKPAEVQIQGGQAVIALELHPQGVGCVAQVRGEPF